MINLITPNDVISQYPTLANRADLPIQCGAAEAILRNHLGRKALVRETGVVTDLGPYYSEAFLRGLEYPIWSVTSVVVDGQTRDPSGYRIVAVPGGSKSVLARIPHGSMWIANQIVVTYEAGYEVGSFDHSLLKSTCVRLAALRSFVDSDPSSTEFINGRSVKKWKVGNFEVEFDGSDMAAMAKGQMPDSMRKAISKYVARVAY